MKSTITKRIEELSNEAAKLLHLKSQHEEALREIEVRMHQIAGAISELDTISKGISDEAGTAGK